MSYQALLFCPDEKTARVVNQVLSELEFTVEPCHEPFAAVKRLMAQHFDAIVVDCDNEQNAALLFKSARNSGSNQASLAVAVVEGQAGVAKAFRLGANLVLTKPIHVEQSKGTLRVARGLLRKGQAAKAAEVPSTSAAASAVPRQSLPAPFPPPQQSIAPLHSASASAFELEAEPAPQPDPAEAALLEYMPDASLSGAENSPQSGAEAGSSKQYPWQPRKPLAEPMASAMRRAAEAAGKSEFDTAPRAASASPAATPRAGISQTGRMGAAAAPARAKEIPSSSDHPLGLEPTASAISAPSDTEIKRITDPSVNDGWPSHSDSPAAEAPSFSSLGDSGQASDAGGGKKTLLIAVLLLALAAAGYYGWTKMQSAHPQPSVQPSATPASTVVAPPPQATPSGPEAQPATGEVAQAPEQDLNGATAVPASAKPSAAVLVEGPGGKTPAPVKPAPAEHEITVVDAPTATSNPEPEPVLIVQNGSSTQAKLVPEAQEAVQAPAATSIANGATNSTLSGIVNTTAINARKAPQEMLRISQGVTEGLIVKRVQPVYPEQARQMRLEGKVELQANISPSGSITGVKQLSGDPILGRAATDAVRQWKYKPYYLNGQPIEIQTQITVNFKLP